jgi:hypothetical protein
VPRWIVFDQVTASALRSCCPQAAVFEAPGRAAVEYALDTPKTLVALLPSAPGEPPVLAVFRPSRPQAAPPARAVPVRATGFLGLNDAPVLDEDEGGAEQVAQKRRWWRRRSE